MQVCDNQGWKGKGKTRPEPVHYHAFLFGQQRIYALLKMCVLPTYLML